MTTSSRVFLAHAKGRSAIRRTGTAAIPIALAITAPLLAGCMVGKKRPDIDHSLVTHSVSAPSSPTAASETLISDADTIKNAISSTDLAALGTSPLPWVNAATGSIGTISKLEQDGDAGAPCRSFETSRHGFDGIALYEGRVCLEEDRVWHLNSFAPVQASDDAVTGKLPG